MKFLQIGSETYVPDGTPVPEALRRTTHLGIAAHQDDLEIMATHGILECFGLKERWFCGVTVTNGSGSPRDGLYRDYSDVQMMAVRKEEQKKAAVLGEYGGMLLLDHPSAAVKDAKASAVRDDLVALFNAIGRPVDLLYTHNLADKHDTHVAVALRVIEACRALPAAARPLKVVGCEVWRDLDWLCDPDKVAMAVDSHENLQMALTGVFDSQICGGKRYDLASAGRRRAHATYHESHGVDQHQALIWGMDLTALVKDASLDPMAHVARHLNRFEMEVTERIKKLS